MNKILEIFGRGLGCDICELLVAWFDSIQSRNEEQCFCEDLIKIYQLLKIRDFPALQAELRIYLFENPDCVYGRLMAAVLCIHKDMPAEAIEQLNIVYSRHTDNTLALFFLGYCCERLERTDEAEEFYQDCLKFREYLQLPRYRLTAIYFAQNKIEKAYEQLELLAENFPDDLNTLVLLGYINILAGEYGRAVEKFDNAILLHPDNFLGDDGELDELLQAGQYFAAADCIGELLASQPDRRDLQLKKADICAKTGQFDEAVIEYTNVCRRYPNFLDAAIKLGTLHKNMGNSFDAAFNYLRAMQINEQILDGYIGLSTAQLNSGQKEQSQKTLSLAAAIAPNSAVLFSETAKLIFGEQAIAVPQGLQVIDLVLETFQTLSEAEPENPIHQYSLGMILFNLRRFSDAAETFKKAYVLNGDFALAATKFALCMQILGKTDSAGKIIQKEVFDGKSKELYYRTALLFASRKNFALAVSSLKEQDTGFCETELYANFSAVLLTLGVIDIPTVFIESIQSAASNARQGAYFHK
ncbi:MAG: tetratricopeptide repeat protein [Phycisphaerae bacterium]|nr:tetratricopeptide repeat protein [Phycisphaerae bacterium]